MSLTEKNYSGLKLQYNKQSVDEILIQRAVKTTTQRYYDKSLFDSSQNAYKVLKELFFTTRCRLELSDKVIDDVQ